LAKINKKVQAMNNNNQNNNNRGQRSSNNQGNGNQRPRFNKRRHHHRRHDNRGQQNQANGGGRQPIERMGQDEVYARYEKLRDTHLEARKKYFEFYYRAEERERLRLEGNFNRTLEDWRLFEDNLSEEQKILLDKRIDQLDYDLDYSLTHDLDPYQEIEIPAEGTEEDPHLLPGQKNHQYREDKEESTGTMDDYLKYKGKL